MTQAEPANKDSGRAVIEHGIITIRIPINNLQTIVEGGWACGWDSPRMLVTNAEAFAKELCVVLNDEDDDGSTRIHKLFDAAIEHAFDQGAEGVGEHEDQEDP